VCVCVCVCVNVLKTEFSANMNSSSVEGLRQRHHAIHQQPPLPPTYRLAQKY